MALSWIRDLLQRHLASNRRTRRAQRASTRPRLEALEDRLAPATRVWDGGSNVNNNWMTAENWDSPNGIVSIPQAGDALVFRGTNVDPTSFTNTNNLVGTAFASITFDGSGYVISGNELRVATIESNGSTSNSLNLEVVAQSRGLTVDVNSNATLRINGQLTVEGGTVNGLSGDGDVTLLGGGQLILNSDNPDFTGQMIVDVGQLVLLKDGALGAAGSAANGTVVNSGGFIKLDGGVAIGNERLEMQGGFDGLQNVSGNNSWAGNIVLTGGNGIVVTAGQLTLSGAISSTGLPTLEKTGPGTLVYSGSISNTHAGLTDVNGGTLVLSKSGGATAISGDLDVGFASHLRFDASNQIADSSSVDLQNGGSMDLNSNSDTFASLDLGGSTVTTGTGTLTLSGDITNSLLGGGRSTLSGNLDFSNGDHVITANASTELEISANISGGGVGTANSLNKRGDGRLILSAANDHQFVTLVTEGILEILNGDALGVGGSNFTQTAVFDLGTLEIGGGITIDDEFLSLNGGLETPATVRNQSGDNFWNGTVNFSQADSLFDVSSGSLTVNGNVIGGSPSDLIKEGAGNLFLAGNNGYSGQTRIDEGTLTIRSSTGLGSTTGGTSVASGATLALEGGSLTVGAEALILDGDGFGSTGALRSVSGNNSWGGTVSLNSDVRIQADSSLTLNGVISGPSANDLRKQGASNLILTAANTYAGSTVIGNGTLTIRNANALGTTASGTVVQPTGTLAIDRPINVTGESLTMGVPNVAGEATLLVTPTARNITWSGSVTLNNDATVRVERDNPTTLPIEVADVTLNLSGVITSANGSTLTKKGDGTLGLTGSTSNVSTLLGGITVADGTLLLAKTGGAQVMGTGTLVIGDTNGTAGSANVILTSPEQFPSITVAVNSDGLLDLNNNNESFSTLNMTAGTVNTGTGTLTVNQVNTTGSPESATINGILRDSGTSTLQITVADGSAASDLIVNASIPTSPVEKSGAGSLVLSGNNTGALTVIAGSAFVNGSQSGLVRVDALPGATATLGGSGSIGQLTLVDGLIDPGAGVDQAGILTVEGNFVVSNGGANTTRTLHIDIVDADGSLVAGEDYDQLRVNGTVNLGNNLTTLFVDNRDMAGTFADDAALVILDNNLSDAVPNTFIGQPQDSVVNVGVDLGDNPIKIFYNGVTGNDVILRRNAGSQFPNRAVTPAIVEGGVATLTGTISDADPNDTFILDITWGDGTPTERHTFPPGSPREVRIQHRYLDNPAGTINGLFSIQLVWQDQLGAGNSDTLSVRVSNANPVVAVRDIRPVDNGHLSRTGTITDVGVLDIITATVDYGDGAVPETLEILRDGSFRLDHAYTRPGTYRVTVTALDDDGGVGRLTFEVRVRNASPRGASTSAEPRGTAQEIADAAMLAFLARNLDDDDSFDFFQPRRKK